MKKEEQRKFIRCCILGAIGGILMAAIYERKHTLLKRSLEHET